MKKKVCCPTCKAKGKDWLKEWQADNDAQIASRKASIADAKRELKEIETKLVALAKQSDTKRQQALNEARDKAQKLVDTLNAQRTEHEAWRSAKLTAEEAERDALNWQAELNVLKYLQETLVAEQARLVEKAFNTLLATARDFTDGFLRSNLVYKDGELGYWRNKTWVGIDTFSGTEKLLAYAGLQMALCQDSPVKLVVFDEFGVMPDEWQQKIAERMLKLLREGKVDQWIVLSCRTSWLSPKLAKHISVITIED